MNTRKPQMAPNWGLMIDDLLKKKLTLAEIGKEMELYLTERMVLHYRMGMQPQKWRGDKLAELWCRTMKKKPAAIPMVGETS